ncbi:hypothetical protein [Streptomyces sp. bgisy100]|uniref:hypothetical protein n=1 Tax=Streptomyces sp. bgisy100 TaxID=3413783 RepID=UPI003D761508
MTVWDPPHLPWERRAVASGALIDGAATALVRPYLIAEELRQLRAGAWSPPAGAAAAGPYWTGGCTGGAA